ncbi:TRAP transporter small permease [Candidatus Atribacteria bacterium 1244-E10-H5-B2]|nr:MAG: TRAP transporter small permease [Candidatus Atribacteria bacterium 1244-E10-H5-B2]
MNLFKKVLRWFFNNVISNLVITFYLILVVALFLQVFTRFVLRIPFFWTDELARYMFISMLFFGAGVAFFEDSHIKLEFITSKFSPKIKKIYGTILNIIIIIYLTVVVWKGFELLNYTYRQRTPALQISRAYPYLAIPIGSIIMILGLIYRIIDTKR